ncbi:MAG TPA: ABC transporter substrate-binding protein [Herpetosiphonaceae bacterium]
MVDQNQTVGQPPNTRRSHRTQPRMQRIVALVALCALLLSACGTPANPTTGTDNTGGAASASPAASAAASPAVSAAASPAASEAASPAAGESAAASPAASASAAATTAATGSTTGVTDSEIVIGSWGPQDGPAGAYGVINRTMDGYFKKLNDEGGINGRKIRFVYENDSYQPAKTVAAVKKLVEEDQVFALVGGLGTPHNLAVMEYLVQNNVPHIAPATGSTLMSQPLKPNVFALQTNYNIEATLLTRYALDNLKGQKFAVFYQNDAFGKEGLDSVNAELKARGLEEAVGVSYEAADTNFSAQALKLQTSGADSVVIWAVPKPAGSIISEMDKIGYKPQLLATAVINDPALFQLAGPGIQGLVLGSWLPDFNDMSNPKIAAYHEFMQKYLPNEPVGGFSLAGVAYSEVLVEGLRRAGQDLTRESLIEALNGMQNFTDGLVPSVSYGPDDHQGAAAIYFMQAKGDKFEKLSDFEELK